MTFRRINRSYTTLIAWIILFQGLGSLGGLVSKPDDWYHSLQKSSLTPSGFVFPVVWTLLYLILAYYAWQVWQDPSTNFRTRCVFLSQMALNFTWSTLFFRFHAVWLSLISITAMILLTLYLIIEHWQNRQPHWVLLTPYLLWLLFAFHLTDIIVSKQSGVSQFKFSEMLK